ncbi:MAG: DMT family transporter [Nitrosomonadales bacterium]|nr:DMT family transporter [Nitrosomonadales bacterium]
MNSNSLSQIDGHSTGIVAGLLSAACFGLMGALVNHLADAVPATEITLFRGLAGVLILFPFVKSELISLFQQGAASVWVRAIAGAISIYCFSWNLQLADVGTANILFNLSLIFVLFGDYVSGRSRLTLSIVANVMLAVAGVSLYWYGSEMIVSGEILALGLTGATAATIAYTALKKATRQYSPWLIVWAVSLMSIPIALARKSGEWVIPSALNAPTLAGIIFSVLLAHYLLNVSFAKLSLPVATALGPSCIVWTVVGVELFQGELPTLQAAAGVLLYSIALGLMIRESRCATS